MIIHSAPIKQKPRKMPPSVIQGTRILGKTGGKPALLFSSMKGIGICSVDGPLEKAIGQLAGLDPRVGTVRPQPFTVDVVSGKILHTYTELQTHRQARERSDVRIREYTPDFEIMLIGGQRVVLEVKDPRFPCTDEYWAKVEKAKRVMFTNGYRYHVVNMKYDPGAPLVHNAGLLTALRINFKKIITPAQVDAIEADVGDSDSTLGRVAELAGLSLREAPILLLQGVVAADLSEGHLRALTPVHLAYGDLQHLAILRFDGGEK